jgi:hypothetical protein
MTSTEPRGQVLQSSWSERGTHPACYVRQHGIEKSLELIHASDARCREGFSAMASRVIDLEVKLEAME